MSIDSLLSCCALLLLGGLCKITFSNLNSMKIMNFWKEFSMLFITMFNKLNFLSEITINRLNSSLTLSIIDRDLNLNFIIWVIKNLWNLCWDGNIVIWLDAIETSTALNIILEDKFVTCKSLDALAFNFVQFFFLVFLVSNLFPCVNIRNSLTLQESLFLLTGLSAHLTFKACGWAIIFVIWFIDNFEGVFHDTTFIFDRTLWIMRFLDTHHDLLWDVVNDFMHDSSI